MRAPAPSGEVSAEYLFDSARILEECRGGKVPQPVSDRIESSQELIRSSRELLRWHAKHLGAGWQHVRQQEQQLRWRERARKEPAFDAVEQILKRYQRLPPGTPEETDEASRD